MERYTGQGDSIYRVREGESCGSLSRQIETGVKEYGDVQRDESNVNKPEKAEPPKIETSCAITEKRILNAMESSSECSSISDFQDSTEGDDANTLPENLCMREYVVICDYVATDNTQLSLCSGDKVLLLNAVSQDWWWVNHNGTCGYVPASHLHDALNEQEDTEVNDPWQDEEYYGSYKTLKLHLEMLSDVPRTMTYQNVILKNSSSLCGKHILDLGCGTGIISFFCAKFAQPEAVYAVEASKIAEQTCRLVEQNGISSLVHVIRQQAEELDLPTKVDVLVSEWMGTCLLFEFMLESVLQARDRWLKEDGVMWPSTACIHLVPCSAYKEYSNKVLFWDNPYQLDFSLLKPPATKEFFAKPQPDYILQPEDCLSEPCTLFHLNLKTLQVAELERMNCDFTFLVHTNGLLHGFTAWFSVQFENLEEQGHLELNTGPFSPLTHWKHTLFMLDEPLQVQKRDKISGSVVFERNSVWRRHMSVTLSWVISRELKMQKVGCKVFPIWR
ncbi:protein arginine N-methyltransferase 2 [Xenopus laevis]|nr:protein arginine N-methyltransferase 2 [Xenopus laevis]ADK11289.1 protein arginine methyltransferase 2 [Xenopus laevis]